MKKLITAAAAAAMLGGLMLAPSAIAASPAGNSDDADNTTTCAQDSAADTGGVLEVYVTDSSVETCSDDETPLDGRIIATTDDGGYIAADGDSSNSDVELDGWIRVNGDGSVEQGCEDDPTTPDDEGTDYDSTDGSQCPASDPAPAG